MAGSALAQDGGRGGNAGNGGRGSGGRGGMGGGRGMGQIAQIIQRVADETELTTREVTQDLFNGQTVSEILIVKGDDPEAFVTSYLADAKTRLDAQVTDGTLTQEQADQRLKTAETELRAFVFDGTIPMGTDGQQGPAGQGVRALVQLGQIIVEQAELDTQTVIQNLRDGKSLETQITDAGKDVATVKQASIDAATKLINDAVTAGTVTQERADQLISNLDAAVDRLLTADLKSLPNGGMGGLMEGRGLAAAVAEATGLTVEEVRAEVTAGKTLGDVLTSKNVAIDTFIEGRLAEVKTRLDERVASGEITQDIADARLDLARAELTGRLDGTFQPKGPQDGAPMTPPDAPMTTPEATAESNA